METINKLATPKLDIGFFEKSRPSAPSDSLKEIVPFIFSQDENVKKGEFKTKKIIKLSEKK